MALSTPYPSKTKKRNAGVQSGYTGCNPLPIYQRRQMPYIHPHEDALLEHWNPLFKSLLKALKKPLYG